jgi:hypothetical protein
MTSQLAYHANRAHMAAASNVSAADAGFQFDSRAALEAA